MKRINYYRKLLRKRKILLTYSENIKILTTIFKGNNLSQNIDITRIIKRNRNINSCWKRIEIKYSEN